MRKLAARPDRRHPDAEDEPEGTLFSSGLIAGAAILGILAAALTFLPGFDKQAGLYPPIAVLARLQELDSALFAGATDLLGVGLLALLGWLMFRGAAPAQKA